MKGPCVFLTSVQLAPLILRGKKASPQITQSSLNKLVFHINSTEWRDKRANSAARLMSGMHLSLTSISVVSHAHFRF